MVYNPIRRISGRKQYDYYNWKTFFVNSREQLFQRNTRKENLPDRKTVVLFRYGETADFVFGHAGCPRCAIVSSSPVGRGWRYEHYYSTRALHSRLLPAALGPSCTRVASLSRHIHTHAHDKIMYAKIASRRILHDVASKTVLFSIAEIFRHDRFSSRT